MIVKNARVAIAITILEQNNTLIMHNLHSRLCTGGGVHLDPTIFKYFPIGISVR